MTTKDSNHLPVIPLSPIIQSYILSSNALSQATEKLNEAKQTNPPVSVDVLRRLIENVRVERHRLEALNRKMQSVEAATPLYWDPDTLARQIAIIDSQLMNDVVLDKQDFSAKSKGISRFVDFHHYLSHNMAHQLIYWVELTKPDNQTLVVPPIQPKENLAHHLLNVAYLLLHAYRDFSGFAAILSCLDLPQVRRLPKLWTPHTRTMFDKLSMILSPENNYKAYRHFLYNQLELHLAQKKMRIAIPWIQPHLASIAADDTLDTELSILELCQGQDMPPPSSVDKHRPAPIYLDGLGAVMPVSHLNSLGPGDELTHHWLVSRVYLDNDQLMHESSQVLPLGPEESIVLPSEPSDVLHDSQQKSSVLSPAAPEFIPSISSREENWEGYLSDEDSEIWKGYPAPSTEDEEEEDEEEIWKGYPGPKSVCSSSSSSSSKRSEEWKGYHATKMEADWQRESELKVKQCEWQGYLVQ
ncbi:hypothetical protein G6F56_007712 [Rhizopus delemar]|uniref:Ras-GEF domain-containing protein n=1 Tax=Rhizopus stolonifer TaxID=4846 RepID=A0A367J937_RHIST|nr:hypothetical protein G6F56_007712 [Rhizopus delemar]RCH86405.1 hypothetical protein CU098_002900 [Rhizopus stolonifer]